MVICGSMGGFQKLIVADSFISRCRGLMGKPLLPNDTAMLLEGCNSVHTFWMRFSIDVIFLDRKGTVLSVRDHVPARRVVANRKAWQVLECSAGQAKLQGIHPGMLLTFKQPMGEETAGRKLPAAAMSTFSFLRGLLRNTRD